MLLIENLTKSYRKEEVLHIDHLEIPSGQAFGLVGNNGAGKTTLFRIILDLIRPTTGTIFIEGQDVSATEDWKRYTGSYVDDKFLIDYLTPEEYFHFLMKVYGLNQNDLDAFLEQFKEIFNDEVIGHRKYIRDLSKGNKKKVGIAAALLGNPSVVLLDEPFENLDPTSQIRLKNIINEYIDKKNVTFLISSHDINHITELCSRIVLLEKGLIHMDLMVNDQTLMELNSYFSGNVGGDRDRDRDREAETKR